MKKTKNIIIALMVIVLLSGCTRGLPNNKGTDNLKEDQGQEPIVSKEIPETFPEELVPLYDLDEVEGAIALGDNYYQAYYFSNSSREEILEKYREYFKDKDVQLFENDYSYELSGNVDGHKITIYIMPYNEEDQNAVTTNNLLDGGAESGSQSEIETPTPTTEGGTTGQRYNTTVIIFIYADTNSVAPVKE